MAATPSEALQVTITAPVVSLRNPMYSGVQVTLPCPSPATVGGLLAAAAGGWGNVDHQLSFAMAFHARGSGTDLETYHPLETAGRKPDPAPRNRDFLADVTLHVWLFEECDIWWQRLRRPRWPLRLGRSQDLVGLSLARVPVLAEPGVQRRAVVPAEAGGTRGVLLRLPTATASGHARNRWGSYRFDATGKAPGLLSESFSTPDGHALVRLPSPHPATVATPSRNEG